MSGPTKYVVKTGSGVTEKFILQYVAPHIRERLGDRVANLLGTTLLYYVFSSEGLEDVLTTIQDRVQNSYLHIRTLPVDINPIRRIPLIIIGHEGEVYMDEIPNFYSVNDDNK